MFHDTIIVGGGPAGLSAALILGRCRRKVLVYDAGQPRNAASHGLHGFLTRDGITPQELLGIAREQLRPYPDVEVRDLEVEEVEINKEHFTVTCADGSSAVGRALVLATGFKDTLPEIPGLRELYGHSVFHCPYCDGWEMRDQPLAVYGRDSSGGRLALELCAWSRDLVLCTDGPSKLGSSLRRQLELRGIPIRSEPITRLEARGTRLNRIIFEQGPPLPRRGLFFATPGKPGSTLVARLGCKTTRSGAAQTNHVKKSSVPGIYVVGDASWDVQLAIIAAAEGAKAAVAIHSDLMKRAIPELIHA